MTVTQEKNELVIRIPMSSPSPSSTGKTLLVATGNATSAVIVDGKPVRVTVSAYIKP